MANYSIEEIPKKRDVFTLEVLVQKAVEKGVGNGRAHGEQNANSVDEIVGVADFKHADVVVAQNVEDVEGKPRGGEYDGYEGQQNVHFEAA